MEKETKRCPYCGEEILEEAKKCKHCGEWLENNEESQGKTGKNDLTFHPEKINGVLPKAAPFAAGMILFLAGARKKNNRLCANFLAVNRLFCYAVQNYDRFDCVSFRK